MKRVIVIIVALVLSGCATIPSTGPVVEVGEGPRAPIGRGADIAPLPPAKHATPEQIIGGFLVAMAASQSDFETARQYLTEDANRAWAPNKHDVNVYDSSQNPITTADGGMLKARKLGVLTQHGRFTTREGELAHNFGLVKVQGQWRISKPPVGVLVSAYMFRRYFDHFSLYFFNSAQKLVAEPIYLPASASTMDRVLAALQHGPSQWLEPSVLTAIPKQGSIQASMGSDGVVTVTLSAALTLLGEEDRRRLGAQLVWTLSQFQRVGGIRVVASGGPLTIPGQSAEGVLDLASQQGFQVLSGAQSNELFAVLDGRLGRTNESGGFMSVPGTLGATKGSVTDVGLSLDGSLAAATTSANKVWFGKTDGEGILVDPGVEQLKQPQVVLGAAWLSGRLNQQTVVVRVDANAAVSKIDIEPVDGTILAIAISPTANRVALLVAQDQRTTLGFMRVDRTGPVWTLRDWRPTLPHANSVLLDDYRSVQWSGETSVVVVASAHTRVHRVFNVSIDGAHVTQLGPSTADIVSASAQPRRSGASVVAITSDKRVLRFDANSRWQRIDSNSFSHVLYSG